MLEAKRKHVFFAEAEPIFSRKLGELHEQTNSQLIMCGADAIGVDMQTVKMSKMTGWEQPACEKIVGGFLKFQPGVHVVLLNDYDHKNFECVFVYLDDQHTDKPYGLSNMYMIQNAYDYPSYGKCLYQFWMLPNCDDMNNIHDFWYE